MSDNTYPTIQHQHARQRQRVIGKALQRLYAETIAEPLHADFLLLLEETDRRHGLATK